MAEHVKVVSKLVQQEDLVGALDALKAWGTKVSTQPSRHVWSVLPLKHAGISPGASIAYTEDLDRKFMDQFFRLRQSDRPYFDPFCMTWLPEGYYHSNLATSRKKTFNNSWHAGALTGDSQSFALDYAQIFSAKALTRSGVTTKLPALSCAIWFYKRPAFEWGHEHPFANGLPPLGGIFEQFRSDFHFQDDGEWGAIFDTALSLEEGLANRWSQ
ncbi:hypothetical protein GCM10027599_00850 [Yimella radicis]